ncbi:MAG: hypothetical protein IT363_05510 [Methanoregulaceae archaeon]|nr:hypothetical protein [Methanoregulaceae archaeon]
MIAFALLAVPPQIELDDLFDRYAKLRNVEISISRSRRLAKHEAQEAGSELVVRYAGQRRFRVDSAEYWGDGTTLVSDGKTLLVVSGGDGRVSLRNTAELLDAHPSLNPPGPSSAILFLFMKGRDSYKRLVADEPHFESGRNWIRFATKSLGVMTLTLRDGWIQEIAYDNRPGSLASYVMFPMWYERPQDPMEIEAITYLFAQRFPARTFDATPPKGVDVEDLRKKP